MITTERPLEDVDPKEVPLQLVILRCSGLEDLGSSVRTNRASWIFANFWW